jgi:predicted regulator of amino acid metabolism with ACT domain
VRFFVRRFILGLHTTTLILCKGALDAWFKTMPDKKILVIVSRVTDLGVVEHVTSQRGMLSI